MKQPILSVSLAGLALLSTTLSIAPASAANPDLVVIFEGGPTTLQAGLSATYEFSVVNYANGGTSAPVEFFIVFAGTLDQTGQVRSNGGMDCDVRHDAGINAAIRCAGMVPGGNRVTVSTQARGQTSGRGTIVLTVNPSHTVLEDFYENNFYQVNVNIQ